MRNLQEQVKKAFCYQKLFWPFTVWINCSSDLKHFANSRPSASNFKSFSWSLEHFFLTVSQNNFGNKVPLHWIYIYFLINTLFYKEIRWFKNNHLPACKKIENIWPYSPVRAKFLSRFLLPYLECFTVTLTWIDMVFVS